MNDNNSHPVIPVDIAETRLAEAKATLENFEREVAQRRRELKSKVREAEVERARYDGAPYDIDLEAAYEVARWIIRDYPTACFRLAANERYHRGIWPKPEPLPADEEVRNNPMKWLRISRKFAKTKLNRTEWKRLYLNIRVLTDPFAGLVDPD